MRIPANARHLKSRRPIPDIFANDRLQERLYQLLDREDPRDTMFVYRVEHGRAITPAFYSGGVFSDLLTWLQHEHGAGRYRVMIKRHGKLMLSGALSVLRPRS